MSLESFGKAVATPVPSNRRYEEGDYIDAKDRLKLAPKQWSMVMDGKYMATSDIAEVLPAGAYEIGLEETSRMPIFNRKGLLHDKIIPLSGLPRQIIKEIDEFWTKEALFTELGFLHRRGYLFYGSHGTGKSSLVHEIADTAVKRGGVVFYCDNPEFFQAGLALFRRVEPNRPVICIFEDIDAIIRKHGESTLLSILDGENQIGRVCNIATTNYPELLDKRIVGRPRRFDRVYRIGALDKKARTAFLKIKLPAKANLEEWVAKTDDLSIASISEAIISVYCFDKPIDEAIQIMRDLAVDKSSDEYRTVRPGFSKNNDEDEWDE